MELKKTIKPIMVSILFLFLGFVLSLLIIEGRTTKNIQSQIVALNLGMTELNNRIVRSMAILAHGIDNINAGSVDSLEFNNLESKISNIEYDVSIIKKDLSDIDTKLDSISEKLK